MITYHEQNSDRQYWQALQAVVIGQQFGDRNLENIKGKICWILYRTTDSESTDNNETLY